MNRTLFFCLACLLEESNRFKNTQLLKMRLNEFFFLHSFTRVSEEGLSGLVIGLKEMNTLTSLSLNFRYFSLKIKNKLSENIEP